MKRPARFKHELKQPARSLTFFLKLFHREMRLNRAFCKVDQNRDGLLSREELGNFLYGEVADIIGSDNIRDMLDFTFEADQNKGDQSVSRMVRERGRERGEGERESEGKRERHSKSQDERGGRV